MFHPCSLLILLLSFLIKNTFACNGYSIQVHSYKNCVPNGVISIEGKNGNIILDKECNLVLQGCLNIKAFKTAKATYVVKKSPLPPMEGDFDLCSLGTDITEAVVPILEMFGIPKQCPVPAKKVCGSPSKKISIAKYKNQIGMAAGKIDLKLELEHDTGKTCLEASLTISKPRKG